MTNNLFDLSQKIVKTVVFREAAANLCLLISGPFGQKTKAINHVLLMLGTI